MQLFLSVVAIENFHTISANSKRLFLVALSKIVESSAKTSFSLAQRFSNRGSPRLYECVADTSRALSTLIILIHRKPNEYPIFYKGP